MAWPSWKRGIGGTLFIGVLTGVGCGIYHFQPHEPIWAAPLGLYEDPEGATLRVQPRCFSADGKRIFGIQEGGPLQRLAAKKAEHQPDLHIWDARTGAEIQAAPQGCNRVRRSAFSPSRRFYAGVYVGADPKGLRFEKSFLWLTDLESGKEHTIDAPLHNIVTMGFCKSEECLAVVVAITDHMIRVFLFDTGTGRKIDSRFGIDWWTIHYENEIFCGERLIYPIDGVPGAESLEIWDARERKVTGVITYPPTSTTSFSPDGRYLIAQRFADAKKSIGAWDIWDLHTCKQMAQFNTKVAQMDRLNGAPQLLEASVPIQHLFSPDGQTLVLLGKFDNRHAIEWRELSTGRLLDVAPIGLQERLLFSPDGRRLIAFIPYTRRPQLNQAESMPDIRLYDAETRKLLWKGDGESPDYRISFTTDSLYWIVSSDQLDDLAIHESSRLDAHNDPIVRLQKFGRVDRGHHCAQQSCRIGASGRPPLERSFARRNSVAAVHEVDRARACAGERPGYARLRSGHGPRVHPPDGDVDLAEALISDDGDTLVTVHHESGAYIMRCWDLAGWKPLRWAIGIPAGAGLAILLLTWWIGRRRSAARV